MSRAPSRAANAGMMNVSSNTVMGMGGANMGKGGISNVGGGTLRRKPTRRPTTRRVTVYDDEEGDDGFVTGETDEFEMANIRVKVRPRGLGFKECGREQTFCSCTTRVMYVGWRFHLRHRSRNSLSA